MSLFKTRYCILWLEPPQNNYDRLQEAFHIFKKDCHFNTCFHNTSLILNCHALYAIEGRGTLALLIILLHDDMDKRFSWIIWSLFLPLLTLPAQLTAQEKLPITLEDIFSKGTFQQKSVHNINWMKDGQFYTSRVSNQNVGADFILQYAIETGNIVDTLVNGQELILPQSQSPFRFDGYTLSPDEQKVLLATQQESIYRRSTKAYFYIYDLKNDQLQPLAGGDKQSYATFSPDGSKVAFVRNNNLYYVDLNTMKEYAITHDGQWNHIIHGSSDWVYEEEFVFAKAFFWSPDGKAIAYYTFDETEVKEYNMQLWTGLYPQDYTFKYPKAGEKNSRIDITIYHLENKKTVAMELGEEEDIYIPRIYWTPGSDMLSIIRMNRLQNKLEILHGDIQSGTTKVVLTEESKTYVDINFTDDLTYLQDKKHFIRTSEKDGYKHIYLHRMDGRLVRQITKGAWEVEEMLGIDENNNLIYYTSTAVSPLERHLYVVGLNGKNNRKLTESAGVHNINMSPDFRYYINYASSARSPLTVSLHTAPSGKRIKILEDNSQLRATLERYQWRPKEFFSFKISDGTALNGYIIKPTDFDPQQRYPVLMYVYGGPGSQLVLNAWGSSRELWLQHLAQQGYIVVCVDNRGTGGRGKGFKDITYGQLGKYEVEDQIEAAKYLASLGYVDDTRIGIWGWSYGGYMSSLCLFLGADYFKAAIAVAPVSSWRFYDTIYTERYLQTPQLNGSGYDDYSPLNHTEKLAGQYLLIHGTGDDNVHFQNAVALVDSLVAHNKQFESFYYPNRNHGIYGGNTSLHLYKMMTSFVLENL